MKRDEYVEYFINHIKEQVPLFDYQEVTLRELLAKEHARQLNILMPKFTEHTVAILTNVSDPESLVNLERKLLDGRSPIQIVMDDLQILKEVEYDKYRRAR